MKKLIEKTNNHYYHGNQGIEVPSKEGRVTEVIPVKGKSQTTAAYAWAAYRHQEMIAAAMGVQHDIPRVPLQFRLDSTGRQQFVAQIPEDVQYMLKPGELVVVYSTDFREKPRYPTAIAELRPGLTTAELLRVAAMLSLTTLTPGAYLTRSIGMREEYIIRNELGDKRHKSSFEPLRNETFLSHLEEEASVVKIASDLRRKRKSESLENRLPISVEGMQVLDDNRDVRFQAVCEPGFEFRKV